MEVARNFLSPPPLILKNPLHFPSSVLMLHEQVASSVTSIPVTSVTRHSPTSVILREPREGVIDKVPMEAGVSAPEENTNGNLEQSYKLFEQQLLRLPDLWHLLALTKEKEDRLLDIEAFNAVALAKKALSASMAASSLAENVKLRGLELDDSLPTSLGSDQLSSLEEVEVIVVKSTRRLERKSKRRRVPKLNLNIHDTSISRRIEIPRKLSGSHNPIQLFLKGQEKQLLTSKEELDLIVQTQDFIRLKEAKSKLQSQFGREPTMVEWADTVGLTCQILRSKLLAGNRSQENLITSNLRLVVHVAKQHNGYGLGIEDLLQEGSFGLMKSIEKFNPKAGCKFATYAFWWVRQTIQKAIYKHSRTIRLPENVYNLLSKVKVARKSFLEEGIHRPPNEELARRAGLTVDKLEEVLINTQSPLSLQQPVWLDQVTTFQDVTADTRVENTDTSAAKQLMRQHVRNLLTVLDPKERRVIGLRYGIGEGKRNTQLETGRKLGLSCAKVRQLEIDALCKLKEQCLDKHDLSAYIDLLL